MLKKSRSNMQNNFNINVRNENRISLSKIFVKTSFSVLTFILCFTLGLYFNIKHNSSFNISYADTLLATYDGNNYFIEGLNGVTTDAPEVKSLSADGDAKGYLFSDGVLILDGSGTITNNLNNRGFDISSIKVILASNGGFTPLVGSDMNWYANECANLEVVDLSNMDASNVTDMNHMFYNNDKLTKVILGSNDSDKRNTALTSMNGMFDNCDILEYADLSCIYSPCLANTKWAFHSCTNLDTVLLQGIDFSNVTAMSDMFYSCNNIKHIDFRNANLTNFNLTDYSLSFNNLEDIYLPQTTNTINDILLVQKAGAKWCGYLDDTLADDTTLFDKVISKTGTVNRLKLEYTPVYTGCVNDGDSDIIYYSYGTSDNSVTLVQAYDIGTTSSQVFGCLYTDGMFILSGNGEAQRLEWCYSDAIRSNIKKIVAADGLKLTGSMTAFAGGCANLEIVDLSNADFSEVTSMDYMFNNCPKLKKILYGSHDISKRNTVVTDINNMASGSSALEYADFSCIYSNVITNATSAFNGDTSLETLIFPGLSFDSMSGSAWMFDSCNFKHIDFRDADLSKMSASNVHLNSCLSNLEEIYLPEKINDSEDITLPSAANYAWYAYLDDDIDSDKKSYKKLIPHTSDYNLLKQNREVLYKRYLNDSHTDEIIYYRDGTSKTGIGLNDSWNLGINEDVGKVNAYLYDDGMFLLDGTGQTDKYSNYTGMDLTVLPWVSKKGDIKIVAASYNGFYPKKVDGAASLNDYFNNSSNLEYFYSENFNLSDVTILNSLFGNCTSLKYIDLTYFNPNVSTYEFLFKGCSNLETIIVPNNFYDNIYNLSGLFSGCSKLDFTNLSNSNLLNFNNIEVNNVSGMFSGCEKLANIDLSNLIITHDPSILGTAVDLHDMFKNCKNLTSVKFGTMDTHTMIQIYGMFSGCENLSSIVGFENIDTSSVLYMDNLFEGCKSLSSINLSNFDTTNVTYFSGMFKDCTGLTSLDLSNFNTTSAEHMKEMFMGCTNLNEIKFPNLTINSGCEIDDMFSDLPSLTKLDISNGSISSFDSNSTKLNTLSKLYEIKVPVSISGSDLSLPIDNTYYQTDEWSGLEANGTTKLTDSFTELSDKTTHPSLVTLIREANDPSPSPAPGGGGHKKKKDDDKEVKPNDDIIPSIKPTINKNSSGYINGYLDGTFKANQNITRGEFCKVIALLTNEYSEDEIELKYNLEAAYKYSDIDSNIWSAKYIGFLTRCNIAEGIGDNLFASEANIKRAEAFKILALLFNTKDNGYTNNFILETKDKWYYEYIDILARGGYIHGYDDGTIRPDRNISRIEVVIMLNNLLERTKDNITNYDLLKNNVVNKFVDVTGDEWFITDLMLAFSYDYDNVYNKSKN